MATVDSVAAAEFPVVYRTNVLLDYRTNVRYAQDMGFNNPAMPWSELERTLSDRRPDGRAAGSPSWNAGGDGPAWTRRRQPFEPSLESTRGVQTPVAPY